MGNQYLLFERDSLSYHCEVIQDGIRKYFAEADRATEFLGLEVADLSLVALREAEHRVGVVCWLDRESSVRGIRNLDLPYLNLRESEEMSNFGHRLTFGGEGTLAAEFLSEAAGLQSLAFVGMAHAQRSRRRFEEFRAEALRRGLSVRGTFLLSGYRDGGAGGGLVFDPAMVEARNRDLSKLLLEIPKPAGIFCADDHIALSLSIRAGLLGIRVPEEISLLGVGGLARAEEGGVQHISVVSLDWERQGYLAAQIMDAQLSGRSCAAPLPLPPDGIIHRGTTHRRSTRDALVERAFQLIEKDRSLSGVELSRQLQVSRRTLNEHFVAVTGLTVAKALELERFRHAKALLGSRHYNHQAIATLAGYRNHKQMIRSFDRLTQMSPKQYARTMGKSYQDLRPLKKDHPGA